MNVLDLFSGIGGFSLGLERAGMRTVAFCEIEPYARAVLAKHWPGVPCYSDVRELTAARLLADGIGRVDVTCGGFPCQDISAAGKGAGLAGERSGLWSEYRRLIEEIRPQFAIVENVAALRSRGLETILGQLAELGYDAEWRCIRAADVGAPHLRNRIWIVAYPQREHGEAWPMADANGIAGHEGRSSDSAQGQRGWNADRGGIGSNVCDTHRPRLALWESERGDDATELSPAFRTDWWLTEPDVGRVANGVPSRVDRLRCLGNSVVPQIVEAIGRAILAVSK